ncbi:hypothetical protein R84B8_02133 [Treponema sp. R8-4-B8]
MTHDKFIAEYYNVSARATACSEKARREGLLSLEDQIDIEKVKQRDILEYGLRFVVDGVDAAVISDLFENIINQEEDKYTRRLMELKLAAVLSIQAGDNTRILAYKLNAFTNFSLTDDPITLKIIKEDFDYNGESTEADETDKGKTTEDEDDKGKFTEEELDELIGGKK